MTEQKAVSEVLIERLKESNELLRSAHDIASRCGEQTNWKAFENQLKKELEAQHKFLFPPPTNSEKVLSEVKKWIDERLALIPRHLDSQYKEVRDKITELEKG